MSDAPRWLGGLPRHDLLVLSLIAALTLGLLVVVTGIGEIALRHYMPSIPGYACLAEDDADGISHGLKNCSGERQLPGAPRVLYSFNECGYRNPSAGCGPKPDDVRRVVLLGASFAEGYPVAIGDSFAGRFEQLMSGRCRDKVQVQNLGAIGNDLAGAYRELQEALSLQPRLIVIAILPSDLSFPNMHAHVLSRNEPIVVHPQHDPGRLAKLMSVGVKLLRLYLVIQELTYRDTEYYVQMYLHNADSADYLRAPLSATWEQRLSDLDLVLADMATRARASGSQLALLFAPSRAQAAILARPAHIDGVDPNLLTERLRQIAQRRSVLLIDATPDVETLKRPELLYFAVDGHPNAQGQDLIAHSMVRAVQTDPLSPFLNCSR